jgi:hypothetical protein
MKDSKVRGLFLIGKKKYKETGTVCIAYPGLL